MSRSRSPMLLYHLDAERVRADVGQHDFVERGVAHLQPGLHRGAQRDDFVGIEVYVGKRPNMRATSERTSGMRVAPPASTTASSSCARMRASRRARSTGVRSRCSSGCAQRRELLVGDRPAQLGLPLYCDRIVADLPDVSGAWLVPPDRAAADTRARSWCFEVRPADLPACSRKRSIIASTKSSPPRKLSPAVARTSITPSNSSRTETSNVPPPRSNTRNLLVLRCVVDAVRERRRGRLVEQALDLQPGQLAGARVALRCVSLK